MLKIGITLICAIIFLLSGRLIQFLKRIIQLITNAILKLLSTLGVKINRRENRLKTSPLFRETFKDIKIVKKSKQNVKIKPSINLTSLILTIFSLLIIVINLNAISGNIISKWLFSLKIGDISIASIIFVNSQKDMDTLFTAVMFSLLSFSASKLLTQWKETSEARKAKKEIKLKETVLNSITSKELLDAAKNKDEENYNKLIEKEK